MLQRFQSPASILLVTIAACLLSLPATAQDTSSATSSTAAIASETTAPAVKPADATTTSADTAAIAEQAAAPKPELPEVEPGAAYLNPDLAPDVRADDLVRRMTLEEKVSQLNNSAAAIPRLKVPEYDWWSECLHGVGIAGIATVFPQSIGLGATWDAPLIHEVAVATSDEARAKHHDAIRNGNHGRFYGLTFWSPNINIFRDPRWGRGQETYGEDPYLTSRLGVQFVRGLQGDDPHYLKLVSTPKHYAVHSGPDPERHKFDAKIDHKNMYESYLPHFEACVREAGAFSIMCAYNRVNGEPACSNTELQEQILRDKWGFQGYIVSDCGAIDDIYKTHKVTQTAAEAAARAIKNGCDLCCGDTFSALKKAVGDGLVTEDVLNRSLKRLFIARFRLGMFDPPERVKYAQIPYSVVDSPANRQLALKAARESIVLLKNENNILPLKKDIKTLAVIGPNADEPEVLLGNYNGVPSARVTPLQGIARAVSPDCKVVYAKGSALSDQESLAPIPGSAILTPEGNPDKHGFLAAYYNNKELSGDPVTTRIDNKIDFDWKERAPMRRMEKDLFSVRWRGKVVAPRAGDYLIGTRTDDGSRLKIDGKLVIDDWNVHGPQSKSVPMHLEQGQVLDVEMEYFDEALGAIAQLIWSAPPEVEHLLEQAETAAKTADTVVLVLGVSTAIENEEHDRTEIALPRPQLELLEHFVAIGKPTVLVLINGGPVSIPLAQQRVPGIVEAWYPGEEGGTAVADVLFGNYNPAGRLPVTVYKSFDQLPPYEDYNMAAGRTYRYFQGEPLYPFGFGLSYTTFQYSNLKVSPATTAANANTTITVTATVANTGKLPGEEVAQLYLASDAKLPNSEDVPQPVRTLEGFQRLHLKPGEKKQVTFDLKPVQYSLVNNEGQTVLAAGRVHVSVGGGQPVPGGSPGNTLAGAFNVTGEPVTIKH